MDDSSSGGRNTLHQAQVLNQVVQCLFVDIKTVARCTTINDVVEERAAAYPVKTSPDLETA